MTIIPGTPLSGESDWIECRSDIQDGEPCIRGTRITVSAIQSFANAGYGYDAIRREYPGLTDEQIDAAKAWSIPAPEAAKADDWIEWTGGENPVPGARVNVQQRHYINDDNSVWTSDEQDWANEGRSFDIIAYRVVSPAPEAAREEGEELKPCPFCGGKADIHVGRHAFTDAIVECDDCNCEGPLQDEAGDLPHEKIAKAIAAWNTRAALRPQAPATAPSDVDGEVEPVAWRYRWKPTDRSEPDDWRPPTSERWSEDERVGFEEQPLYAPLTALTEAREQARLDGDALEPFAAHYALYAAYTPPMTVIPITVEYRAIKRAAEALAALKTGDA